MSTRERPWRTEQRLQHQHPGHRVSDPHAWQQREYLADWGRRLQRRRSLRVYRLAPDSVRPGEDRRHRRQRPADAGRIRPGPGLRQPFRSVLPRRGGRRQHPHPTCSVDAGSQNVTVPLGSVYRTAFQGAGSTTAPSAFSFRLNCNSLPAGQGNTVMITMDATADPSGQPEHCAWPQPDRVRSRAAWAYRYAMRSTTRSCSARPSTWGHRSRRATSCPSPRATSRPPAR